MATFSRIFVALFFANSFMVQYIQSTDEGLFLTPLIDKGDVSKAESFAKDNLKLADIPDFDGAPLTSFSGYLTVNKTYESNMFFWFFPAIENPSTAPLIVWVNDFPGVSSLEKIFVSIGPFIINDKNRPVVNPNTWIKRHSMIFMDAPVGTGFSFMKNTKGYAASSQAIAHELFEALRQIFLMFPAYKGRDLYLGGIGVSGKFLPLLGVMIDSHNIQEPKSKINFKGMVIGAPYIDSLEQETFSSHYQSLGLITSSQAAIVQKEEQKVKDLIRAGKFGEAFDADLRLIYGENSLLSEFTGYTEFQNILQPVHSELYNRFKRFVSTTALHSMLHIGIHTYIPENTNLETRLRSFYLAPDSTGSLEKLLNKEYKILFYTGQLDLQILHAPVIEALRKLKWKDSSAFFSSPRSLWKVNNTLVGYISRANNFAHIHMLNAGYNAIMDQPVWGEDMIYTFTHGKF